MCMLKSKAGINEAEEYVLGDRLLETVAALRAWEPEREAERGIENYATLSQNVKIQLCLMEIFECEYAPE